MERTGDDLPLLFPGEFIEVDGIAGDADCQVGILLRILTGVHQNFPVQHIYIQMSHNSSTQQTNMTSGYSSAHKRVIGEFLLLKNKQTKDTKINGTG